MLTSLGMWCHSQFLRRLGEYGIFMMEIRRKYSVSMLCMGLFRREVLRSNYIHCRIFTMVAYFLHWTLLKYFSSIPDEQSQQKVWQLGRITCTVINTSNEVKCSLLWEFLIYNFSRRILESVFVGSIVNIRNECLFVWIHGEWIVARNKQIVREPLRGSRDLFVPRYDSFPMNPEKRHSFLKCTCTFQLSTIFGKAWNMYTGHCPRAF